MVSEPFITANALAEYMDARDERREGIVRQFRDEHKAPPIRYSKARDAISAMLADPHRNPKIIHDAIENLKNDYDTATQIEKAQSRAFHTSNASLSIKALEGFLFMRNELPFLNNILESYDDGAIKIDIEGVKVHAKPDILIRKKDSKGSMRVGAGLFFFSHAGDDISDKRKNDRKRRMGWAASVLWYLVSYKFTHLGAPSNKICYSIDPFMQESHAASPALKKAMRDIESACRSYRAQWHYV